MLTRYGTSNIVIMLTIGIILLCWGLFFSESWQAFFLILIGGGLTGFTFIFFRDPERKTPQRCIEDESYIVSPADGKVVDIVEIEEPFYIKDNCKRISIFLSPLDVHVNRTPCTGVVEFFKFIKGKYLVADKPEASEKNAQTIIGVRNKYGKIVFKQIVGILARRLVCDLKEGDTCIIGERFGMMKFGSRMDIFLPLDTDIYIKVNQRVIAGESILAKLKIK